jgi:hypothetical protein
MEINGVDVGTGAYSIFPSFFLLTPVAIGFANGTIDTVQ